MFKKTKTILYVFAISLGILLAVLSIFLSMNSTWNSSEYLFEILLVVFLCILIAVALIMQMDNKIHRELIGYSYDCRPDKMLEGYIEKSARHLQTGHTRVYYINLSAAYMGLGQWQMAKDCLHKVPLTPKVTIFATTNMTVNNNLCLCHLALGEMEEAAACIAWLVEQIKALHAKKPLNPMTDKHENRALALMYLYQIKRGNDAGAESYFEKTGQMAVTLLEKVETQYCLGGLYLRRGALNEARTAFEYAAQNGGTTWYAGAAAAQLQQM